MLLTIACARCTIVVGDSPAQISYYEKMEGKKMLMLKNGTTAFDSQELIKAYEADPKVLDVALEDTATGYAEMTDGDVDGWVEFMREFVTNNANTTKEMEGKKMITNVKVCENCGRIIGEGEDYIIDGYDRIICEDCRQNMYYCEDCDNYYDEGDMVAIFDRYGDIVQFVCTGCAETYYNQCPECGRWYVDSAFDGRGVCARCVPEVILSYHSGNPSGLKFHGNAEYSFINGYIGGELEITGLDDRAAADILEACGGNDFCHFEHDCSVDGAEIIFQPRTIEQWEAARPAVNSMYDILTEYDCTSERSFTPTATITCIFMILPMKHRPTRLLALCAYSLTTISCCAVTLQAVAALMRLTGRATAMNTARKNKNALPNVVVVTAISLSMLPTAILWKSDWAAARWILTGFMDGFTS